MKKTLITLLLLAILTGCAATNYKNARAHANDVRNGMTVAEVVAIIGIPPTDQDERRIQWRRGDAQAYDGTKNGAILYELATGRVVNIPDGGIYSPAAAEKARFAREEKKAVDDAMWLEEQNAKSVAADERKKRESDAKAAEVAKLSAQFEKEMAASRRSTYTCPDKAICAKAFSLAQIFVSNNSDQKIQVATDTIIETYNPTDTGKLGMKIVKTPSRGSSEMISVTPICKDGDFSTLLCSMRRTIVYEQFRPYIETALSR